MFELCSLYYVEVFIQVQGRGRNRAKDTLQYPFANKHYGPSFSFSATFSINLYYHSLISNNYLVMAYNQLAPPMMAHQSIVEKDAYNGKSAETRHLKPGEISTGTTIMAVQFDGGVVLCAGEL